MNRIRETTRPARVRTPSTRCCAPARMTHWNLFDVRARDVTLTDSAFPFRYVSMRRVVCITRNAYPVTRELRRSPSSVIYSELLIVSGICDDRTFYTSNVTIIMGKNWTKNLTKMIWWVAIQMKILQIPLNVNIFEYFFESN